MNNLAAFSFYFPNQVSSFVARVAADPVISTNIRMNVIASDCVPVPVSLSRGVKLRITPRYAVYL
jgi:hypothetical protein